MPVEGRLVPAQSGRSSRRGLGGGQGAGDPGRGTAQAAVGITAEADAVGPTAGQRHGAEACVRYLTSKHEFLRYDQALAAGWPIATGVIEGAYRHLIGDRPDITGAGEAWMAPRPSSPCAR
jgi:hypothetical protein